jgi:hypothetical protein
MKRLMLGGILTAAFFAPRATVANDRFEPDDGPWQSGLTDTELTAGARQIHDMEAAGTADEDWYIISQRPYSSYEVRVDSMGDSLTLTTGAGDALAVDLVQSDGTLISSGYIISAVGTARTLTFANDTATQIDDQAIRVSSPFCDTACSALASQYDIRLYDTTYMIPRFNNSATQITILIVQNSSDRSVSMTAHFFDAAGTLLASQPQTIAAHGTYVVNTSGIGGLAGQSGSIIVTNSGGYGVLSGKGVALEPATGFTFDTTMAHRPQ